MVVISKEKMDLTIYFLIIINSIYLPQLNIIYTSQGEVKFDSDSILI